MFITATGMVCPIGFSAVAACAAKRAGISAFKDLPYHDNAGEPIIGAAVAGIEWSWQRPKRLIELLTKALTDLLKGQQTAWEQVPLLVGLAEGGRPGGGGGLSTSIVNSLQEALKVRFHPQYSKAIALGHTSAFEALRVARELLSGGNAASCIICGVDSLLNARTLHWLDDSFRLKTSLNEHALIPGEAAAAVLVQGTPGPKSNTEIIGLGFGMEKAHILSEEPLLGLGLTEAVRKALAEAKLGLHQIDCRVSDLTGEQYGFKELPLVEGRLMRVVRKKEQPLWHWVEAIGDSGAAAGVVQLVAADEAYGKGYAPGESMICLTSSVAGDRAAAVLRHHCVAKTS